MTMDNLSQRVQSFLDAYAGGAPVPESVVEIVGDLENGRRRFRAALEQIRDGQLIQGMSPALFAEKVLGSSDSAQPESEK